MSQEESLDKISSEPLTAVKTIPLELFSNRTAKTVRLINNADPEYSVRGTNRDYNFSLNEPVYVASLKIKVNNYRNGHTIKARWNGYRDSYSANAIGECNNGHICIEINDLVRNFSFRPDSKIIGSGEILQLTVLGYDHEEFLEVMSQLSNIEGARNQLVSEANRVIEQARACQTTIDEYEGNKTELTDAINALEEDIKQKESLIEIRVKERNTLIDEIEKKTTEKNNVDLIAASLADSIDQKKNEQRALNTVIVEKTGALKALNSDINVFPSELAGYNDRAGVNKRRYLFLAAVPITILVAFTLRLFLNAENLATVYNTQADMDIWSIFSSRMPFVIISMAVVAGCFTLIKVFIGELIKISDQQLSLAKISIVATEVVEAGANGLDLDDNELMGRRLELKMALLRAHLKFDINQDYTYKAKAIPKKGKDVEDEINEDEEE